MTSRDQYASICSRAISRRVGLVGPRCTPVVLFEKTADRLVIESNVVPLVFRPSGRIRQDPYDRALLSCLWVQIRPGERYPVAA